MTGKGQHTAGPWRLEWSRTRAGIPRPHVEPVADIRLVVPSGDPEANARLIAAAPRTLTERDALLEALRAIGEEFEYGKVGADGNEDYEAMAQAMYDHSRAAIRLALAEGEQE